MSAVYTSPEARGRGLAKALIKAAAAEARRKAQSRGKPLVLSVVVYATNSAAISLYECCGFVRDPGGPKLTFNTCKNSSSQELDMYFSGA
jgi:ribosomal protein S18 acetylase RimI-like enzyme